MFLTRGMGCLYRKRKAGSAVFGSRADFQLTSISINIILIINITTVTSICQLEPIAATMRGLSTVSFVVGLLALLLNAYIYTYPSLNSQQCSWKQYNSNEFIDTNSIQYKLSQIPYVGDLINTHYFKKFAQDHDDNEYIKLLAVGDPQINGNWPQTPYIKRLDNYGNDHYLGHIYKTMKNRLQPSHVAVMGDLFSSQWIGDSEFFNRTRRYLTRLYPQPANHTKEIFQILDEHKDFDWHSYIHEVKSTPLDAFEYGYEDVYDWVNSLASSYTGEPLFINITGNHDVGYSGDATWQHMTRYHKLFGKDNFWIEYHRNTDRAYRIVVLNSLFLEGPALQEEFIQYTYNFLDKLAKREFNGSTILLTHVPFYKKAGLCTDGPKHVYYDEQTSQREPYKLGKLRSQNHLSFEVSQKVLNTIFSNGKPGIILTGHDHEGCYNVYNKDQSTGTWTADESKSVNKENGEANANFVQEITVRAVMGDYDGNIGIMTGHFDEGGKQWEFNYSACPFIVQHVWWVTKVTTAIALFLQSFTLFA